MPRYWVTTHWPPHKPIPNDTFNIHIQDKFKKDLSELQKGDKVLFYEFKSGPNITDPAGEVIHRRQCGMEGIVCEAELKTDLHPRPNYVPEYFEGKGKRNFCWQALTESRISGYVPRVVVNKTLGYQSGYTFMGFNGGRGIKQISAAQHAELHALFTGAGARRKDFERYLAAVPQREPIETDRLPE